MNPTLMSWILSIPYLLTGIGFLIIGWAAGGYAYALLCGRDSATEQPWYLNVTGAGLFLLVVRIAAGLALISWIGAVLGVAGFFSAKLVFPILLPVIALGLPVAFRFALRHKPMLLRDRLELGYSWLTSSRSEKIFGAVVILGFCAVIVNALIGALVPDMNQDPMWYHLSVPQQWMFAGEFEVYPDVMPSAYPLAVESIYAVIFLLKTDPVLCSLLSALCGAMLFCAMAAAAAMAVAKDRVKSLRGWGIGAVIGIWVPMLTVYGMIAPIQPKNDIITMLWTFTGAMLLWLPLLRSRESVPIKWWLVAGFLLGTACSAKPPVLAISFFLILFAVGASWTIERKSRGGWGKKTFSGAIVCGAMMIVAAAPWIIRGWQSHGLPLYPLGYGLFETSPKYEPLLTAFFGIIDVTGGDSSEWLKMIISFPTRLVESGQNGEKCVFLYIVISIAGVAATRGVWRWFAIMLIAQMTILIGMKGAAEIYRLFAPAYTLATPLIAWLCAKYAAKISRSGRIMAALLLYIGTAASVGWHQYRIANFRTMDWQFRPVLSAPDVDAYADHAEKGGLYIDLRQAANHIAPNERVLLLNSTYPFYLHRNTVWNDEAIHEGGIQDRWENMTLQQAQAYLEQEKIDVILYASGAEKLKDPTSPIAILQDSGALTSVELPKEMTERGWALYRVK